MEVQLIILAFIFLTVEIVNLYGKITSKRAIKKQDVLLKTLPKFTIPLDLIKINGTYWQESVPVDIYDNELNPNDPYLYGRDNFGIFNSSLNKFHRQKNKTKFSTKLYIKIPYLGATYDYNFSLPIEDTNIRIKFYLEKTIVIYVEKQKASENSKNIELIRFLLDFRFLDNEKITIISTGFMKTKSFKKKLIK